MMTARMNDCRGIELLLTEYVAGDLDTRQETLVAIHLARCAACRQEAAREVRLRKDLAGLPTQRCPAHLNRRLETIGAEPGRRFGRRRGRIPFAGPGLAAAALLAACLVPGLLDRTLSTSDRAADSSWTEEEISAARRDMLYTLTLTAEVLDRTGIKTMADVFGDRIPEAVTGSFKFKPTTRGDKG